MMELNASSPLPTIFPSAPLWSMSASHSWSRIQASMLEREAYQFKGEAKGVDP
jgi:hypothetical protein